MCPNTEFFLVRIFPHSDWIRKDTSYLSVFSPNAGKYGPEKTPYLDTFHAMKLCVLQSCDHIINTLKNEEINAKCISTYDLSPFYTKLPHNNLLDVLFQLNDFLFKEVTKLSLKLPLKKRILKLKAVLNLLITY